jgi:hypothetical protein
MIKGLIFYQIIKLYDNVLNNITNLLEKKKDKQKF